MKTKTSLTINPSEIASIMKELREAQDLARDQENMRMRCETENEELRLTNESLKRSLEAIEVHNAALAVRLAKFTREAEQKRIKSAILKRNKNSSQGLKKKFKKQFVNQIKLN